MHERRLTADYFWVNSVFLKDTSELLLSVWLRPSVVLGCC